MAPKRPIGLQRLFHPEQISILFRVPWEWGCMIAKYVFGEEKLNVPAASCADG